MAKNFFRRFLHNMLMSNLVTPYKQVSFGTYFNNVKNDYDKKVIYRGDTCMCRDDLYFPDFVSFLNDKYNSVPNVNVIAHACSDGEEVYSFLGVLKSQLGDKADKFLPVIAKDIEPEHLARAQKGKYYLRAYEHYVANASMNNKFCDYFENSDSPIDIDIKNNFKFSEKPIQVRVKDCLKNNVIFKQGNIIYDVNKTDFTNTVLLARNFWPYLSFDDRKRLANTLSKKMDETSTLVIGDYDKDEANVDALLKSYGFVETAVENVYEKLKPEKNKDNKNIFSFYMLHLNKKA